MNLAAFLIFRWFTFKWASFNFKARTVYRLQKYYQYTAIDEFSRFRYVEAFQEISTYSSTVFLDHMLKAFPFNVECVQTDNGSEFTKHYGSSNSSALTMFEKRLKEYGIRHKKIKPFTPKQFRCPIRKVHYRYHRDPGIQWKTVCICDFRLLWS